MRIRTRRAVAAGRQQTFVLSGAYDGKDNKVNGANPNGDTVALTRVDANTVQQVNKSAGKVTTTQVAGLTTTAIRFMRYPRGPRS
jgi:hypothetical protein